MKAATDDSTYLITGALGCIGSWALFHLHQSGKKAVSLDLGDDRRRLDLLLSREEQASIAFEQGDLRDKGRLLAVIEQHNVTRIIHLAALQVPFCKADPVLGAEVNVVGTVNVFEAARAQGIQHLAHASSVAVYGPPDRYDRSILMDDSPVSPNTLYGVYKVANEGTARVYWMDHGISSVAFRPYTVYGIGRDQGLTSDPTKAMLAAVKGEDYEIGFSGRMQFQWASDMARYFIAAAETPYDGAAAFNFGTTPASVDDVVQLIREMRPGVEISYRNNDLPFPAGMDGSSLQEYLPEMQETSLEEGVRLTIAQFESALARGVLG